MEKDFEFQEYNILLLIDPNPQIRSKAEQQHTLSLTTPLEYYNFLTKIITGSIDLGIVTVAFSTLRMLVKDGKFDSNQLVYILQFYSDLFVKSRVKFLTNALSAFLETLLTKLQIQATQLQIKGDQSPAIACYLSIERFLFDPNSLCTVSSQSLLLDLLCIYLAHFKTFNCNLKIHKPSKFSQVYQAVNAIRFEESQDPREMKILVGKFFSILLINLREFDIEVIKEYIKIIPKQICENIQFLLYADAISIPQGDKLLFFFLDFLNQQSSFDLEECLKISHCLQQLLDYIIGNIADIQQALIMEDNENDQEAIIQKIDFNVLDNRQRETIFLWVFKMLILQGDISSQMLIFKLASPLQPLNRQYMTFETQIYNASHFVFWTISELRKGESGNLQYERFCYYFYYLHGQYFMDHYLESQKIQIAILCKNDLLKMRFRAVGMNLNSILYYLRIFINSKLATKNFYVEIVDIISKMFSSFTKQQIPQVFLVCMCQQFQKSQQLDNFVSSLWSQISHSKEHKVDIIISLRDRIAGLDHLPNYFLSDLLVLLAGSPSIFEIYYYTQPLSVKVQYLRLVCTSLGRMKEIFSVLAELTPFLELIGQYTIKELLQVQEIFELYSEFIGKYNKNPRKYQDFNFSSIFDSILKIALKFKSEILSSRRLLVEIAAMPYSEEKTIQKISIYQLQTTIVKLILEVNKIQQNHCNALEVFLTVNPLAINSELKRVLLAKTSKTVYYYRMAYLLAPIGQPIPFIPQVIDLKYFKWLSLAIIAQYKPPTFEEVSRARKDKLTELSQKMSTLGLHLDENDCINLQILKKRLESYNKDSENWIEGLRQTSVFQNFKNLHRERYSRAAILEEINIILESHSVLQDRKQKEK